MGITKTISSLAIIAGSFLVGYNLQTNQNVRVEKDRVVLRQCGIERVLVLNPTEAGRWDVQRIPALDTACDKVIEAGKWIYAQANNAYEDYNNSSKQNRASK